MGAELFAWMLEQPDNSDYHSAAEQLSERFGLEPNVEELLTEIQERIKSLESGGSHERAERAQLSYWRGWLVHAVRQWFREIHSRPAPGYEAFSKRVVAEGDVIITFNYDDSLECELHRAEKWDVHRGYGFVVGEERASPTLVLKLHGSINWMALIFGGVTSGFGMVGSNLSLGFGPRIPAPDLNFLGYNDVPGHEFPGGGAFPALIMPTRKKEFFYTTSFGAEWEEFWNRLWEKAADALKHADDIILCGYNLLPVDERACELLLQVPDKKIPVIVVSGDQSERISREFQLKGFSRVRCEQNIFFENWVKSAVPAAESGESP
jgi:hypothetical protein